MPLYEYYCADCRTKFEARRPMREADTAIACAECESQRTTRVLSLFAMIGSAKRSDSAMPSANFGGCCGGSCGCRH
jgi:putative FmdB family regulatory protein